MTRPSYFRTIAQPVPPLTPVLVPATRLPLEADERVDNSPPVRLDLRRSEAPLAVSPEPPAAGTLPSPPVTGHPSEAAAMPSSEARRPPILDEVPPMRSAEPRAAEHVERTVPPVPTASAEGHSSSDPRANMVPRGPAVSRVPPASARPRRPFPTGPMTSDPRAPVAPSAARPGALAGEGLTFRADAVTVGGPSAGDPRSESVGDAPRAPAAAPGVSAPTSIVPVSAVPASAAAAASGPTITIGTIDVRVVDTPRRAAIPAPAPSARPAEASPAPLARGLVGSFGLRQG